MTELTIKEEDQETFQQKVRDYMDKGFVLDGEPRVEYKNETPLFIQKVKKDG